MLGGIVVIGVIFFSGTSLYQWVWLPAWPIASVLIVNYLAARPRHRQLKQLGRQARVIGTNYPQLHRLLTEQTQLLGLKKSPDMYVIADESPYICSLPSGAGAVIVTQPLLDLLGDEEFATLLAHELAHLKFHHLRLELAMIYLENATLVLQWAFAPVAVWARLMGQWRDVIDYTADRIATVVTHHPAPLMRAIIRTAAAADRQANVSQEEIDSYLASTSDLEVDSGQMERYFKISQFVNDQPNMRDRLEEIQQFSASEQAQAGWQKMAQLRQELGLDHSAAG